MSLPERDHALEETENILISSKLAPVQPSSFVVLVIRIVVAELRVEEFVPGPEHRDPVRQQQQAAEILNLLPAQRQHGRWRSFVSFVPTVPTVVVIHAILVVVTICPVVLAVVGDKIVQREAVVRRYIVQALIGVIGVGAVVGKQVIAAIDASHQVRDHPWIALDETANVVTETSVPLEPIYAWESATELISARVPRFCDQT